MTVKLIILSLLIAGVLAQDETTTQEPIVTTVTEDVTEEVTTEFLPTLSPNVATKLVPAIKKNMQNALKKEDQSTENEVEVLPDRFKRRKKLDQPSNLAPVKNSTAAEILLHKVKSKSRVRTYHDPEFKNSKKLVRIRPRVKSLTELKSETQTENSPIIETNALLLDSQNAPQGSQPFDWSRRKVLNPRISNFKNRFRKYQNKPTEEPEAEDSTEVHVVTSISDEHETTSTTTVKPVVASTPQSYQYVSFGTLEPTTSTEEPVLELEKLFLNEKLNVEDSEKKKRKVDSRPAPVQVDSQIKVVDRVPSQALPTSYVAPGLRPEQVKDFVGKEAIIGESAEYDYTSEENVPFLDNLTDDLDKLIISSVEEALQVSIPADSTLRTRDVKKSRKPNDGKVRFLNCFAWHNSVQKMCKPSQFWC